jgi:hypothetical protein
MGAGLSGVIRKARSGEMMDLRLLAYMETVMDHYIGTATVSFTVKETNPL